MKRYFTLLLFALFMVVAMTSCSGIFDKKEKEEPKVDNPLDHISVPRAEYMIRDSWAYKVRFAVSNQWNQTLYYVKFRCSECNKDGNAFYSKVYEAGSKEDPTVWTILSGDIDFTYYFDCDFVFDDGGSIKSEIIDARFY